MSDPKVDYIKGILSAAQSEAGAARPIANLNKALSEAKEKLEARATVGGALNMDEVSVLYDNVAAAATAVNEWQIPIPNKEDFIATISGL